MADSGWGLLALTISFVLLFLALSTKSVSTFCIFPSEWIGDWHEADLGTITVSPTNITRKGVCQQTEHEFYLLENREIGCYTCLVIQQRHQNILQYKESFCVGKDTLYHICTTIHGQTLQRTLIRVNTEQPTACPFHNAFHFIYSNNSGGFCRNPVSYVKPCSISTRLMFHFKQCSDAAYTYNREMDLQCLASWRDGSQTFLIGQTVETSSVTSAIVQYRCFIYRILGSVVHLSMSIDASCRGLRSSSDGPVVMELTTDTFGWPTPRCTYPAFVTRNSWRDLVGAFHFQANDMGNVITQSKRNASVSNPASLSSSSTGVIRLLLCHSVITKNVSDDNFLAVSFVLDGCSFGYHCLRFVKKADGVIQYNQGLLMNHASESCLSSRMYQSDRRLLISESTSPRPCPMEGRYLIHTGMDDCKSYFRSGCNASTVIEITSSCSPRSGLRLECLRKWREDKQRFVVARVMSDVSGVANCFSFRRKFDTLLFSTDSMCNLGAPNLHDRITYVLSQQPLKCESSPDGATINKDDVVHDNLKDTIVETGDAAMVTFKKISASNGHVDETKRSRDYRTSARVPSAANRQDKLASFKLRTVGIGFKACVVSFLLRARHIHS